jgi:hypothetical protein
MTFSQLNSRGDRYRTGDLSEAETPLYSLTAGRVGFGGRLRLQQAHCPARYSYWTPRAGHSES